MIANRGSMSFSRLNKRATTLKNLELYSNIIKKKDLVTLQNSSEFNLSIRDKAIRNYTMSVSENRKMSQSSRKLSMKLDTEVVEAFNLFDTDKDGRITKTEIINMITNLGGDPNCPHVQELLTGAEENANKSLDVNQFMLLWKEFKKSVNEEEETEEEIQSAFKDYDRDGDGYITKDELMEAMVRMGFVNNKEEETNRCMKDMDLDGDGKVSYAEFMVKWRVT